MNLSIIPNLKGMTISTEEAVDCVAVIDLRSFLIKSAQVIMPRIAMPVPLRRIRYKAMEKFD